MYTVNDTIRDWDIVQDKAVTDKIKITYVRTISFWFSKVQIFYKLSERNARIPECGRKTISCDCNGDVYNHLNEMKEPQEETYDTHAQRLRRVTSEIWTMIVTCMVLMIALLFLMERRMVIILLQNTIKFFTMIDDYFIIEQHYKFLHFLFSMIIVFEKKIKSFF